MPTNMDIDVTRKSLRCMLYIYTNTHASIYIYTLVHNTLARVFVDAYVSVNNVCMCVDMCIYTCIPVYPYSSIHAHIYINTCKFAAVCMYISLSIYLFIHLSTYLSFYIFIFPSIYLLVCICICTYQYLSVHMITRHMQHPQLI